MRPLRSARRPPVHGVSAFGATLLGAALLGACGDERAPHGQDRTAREPGAGPLQPSATPSEPTAGAPTYHRDVAPILDAHCVTCHREGQFAPFALRTFEDARKRAKQIAIVTNSGFMPPWLPAPGEHAFRGERRLGAEEIATLGRWAEGGAPAGDPDDRPPPPEFDGDWMLGPPDLVVTMPVVFTVPAEGTDLFRNFVLPTDEDEPRYVRAIDLRPGSPRVVHHAVLQVDTTGSAARLDGADGEPGFVGMEAASDAISPNGFFLGWTPGKVPYAGTPGLAWTLEPGADLVLNLHLQTIGKPEPVRATVGLYLTDEKPTIEPLQLRLGSETIEIPPGESDWRLRDRYTLPVAVDVLGLYPHAHYLGAEMRAWATLPNGIQRELMTIPEWDFQWQDDYAFARPVHLPAGTRLEIDYRYDNSAANPFNPSSPPKLVRYGPESRDEMGDLWLQVTTASPVERARLAADFQRSDALRKIAGHRFRLAHEPDSALDHAALGYWLLVGGELSEASTHLRRAVELDGTRPRAFNNLGFAALRLGRLDEAHDAFARAVELAPDSADALNNMGLVLLEQGQLEASESFFAQAVEARSDFAEAWNNLGRVRERSGRSAGAREAFSRAVEARPSYAKAHYNLAQLERRAGRKDEQLAALEATVRHAPEFARAHGELGLLLWSERRPRRAIEHLRQAVRGEASLAHLEPLAWALATCPLAELRDPNEAEQLAQRALEMASTDAERARCGRTLAAALAGRGELERAQRVVEEALATLEPSDPLAAALRADLARYRR